MENAKIQKFKCDILSHFQTLCTQLKKLKYRQSIDFLLVSLRFYLVLDEAGSSSDAVSVVDLVEVMDLWGL